MKSTSTKNRLNRFPTGTETFFSRCWKIRRGRTKLSGKLQPSTSDAMSEWHIEPLDRSHQRGEFCCGKAPLDEFLRSLVSQYEKRKLGKTYVAVQPNEKKVCGYYTLASGSIP